MNGSQPAKKPSRWRYLFFTIFVVQLIGVSGTIALLMWAASFGPSLASYGLWLAYGVWIALGLVALATINIIGLLIYLIIQRPKTRSLLFWLLSMTISGCVWLTAGPVAVFAFREWAF